LGELPDGWEVRALARTADSTARPRRRAQANRPTTAPRAIKLTAPRRMPCASWRHRAPSSRAGGRAARCFSASRQSRRRSGP